MRIVTLTEDTKKNILEDLLKRSPNNYGQYEATVADIVNNVMINGEWDEEKDERGMAYVAGVEAFWHGQVGFEKSPEYKLTAATPLFSFDPEKEHNIKMGSVDGKVFVLVDDELCLEIQDPDPLDVNKYGKIGFEAYSSWWKFQGLKVYKLKYEKIEEYYNPEF